ncbi:MAG: hypothetical protein DCF16_08485 [Alphaproteobacteria bacterium]|nr:MAG: hypothetical protein DCF16_08485 [Alphaproteobacteria bacterium]
MAKSRLHPSRRCLLTLAGLGAATLALGALAGCGNAAAEPLPMAVRRNPGCGCCEAWRRQMEASGRFIVTTQDDPALNAFKQARGVPADLASCHTAVVGDYVVEGHVPLADVLRLLDERPAVLGIAVGGMPMGSPGMEQPGGGNEAYDVIAFDAGGGRHVFTHHPAA